MLVEGYWSTKSFTATIQNKNLPFLERIEEIIKGLDMPMHRMILLKIKVDDNIKKEDIDKSGNAWKYSIKPK